mgnify:CR=1 FL=1
MALWCILQFHQDVWILGLCLTKIQKNLDSFFHNNVNKHDNKNRWTRRFVCKSILCCDIHCSKVVISKRMGCRWYKNIWNYSFCFGKFLMKKYESKIVPGRLHISLSTIDITITAFKNEEIQQLYIFVTWYDNPNGRFKIDFS